jgi:hypothetical protein
MEPARLFWLVYLSAVALFGLLAVAAVAIGELGLREARFGLTALILIKEIWGKLDAGGDSRAGLSAFLVGVVGFLLAPAVRRLREAS